MLGGVVPVELVIGLSDRAAVALVGIVAYPTGFSFTLASRRRNPDPADRHWKPPHELDAPMMEGRLPPTLLRFGFQFADGEKLTSIPRASPQLDFDSEPSGPTMFPRAGGGDSAAWDSDFWVWRLPPPGPVTVVCEWPSEGIDETRTTLSSEEFLAASARAQVLWDDPGPTAGGSWSMASFARASAQPEEGSTQATESGGP